MTAPPEDTTADLHAVIAALQAERDAAVMEQADRIGVRVTDAEAEIGYYEGDGLLLEDVLREQVLLALPLKVTCSEDCRGLCLHCGKNLNQEKCSCAVPMEDPRWLALKEIRERLEN